VLPVAAALEEVRLAGEMKRPLMEPSGRNRWHRSQMRRRRKRLRQAKTVAVGCDRLPGEAHGKEGVDGSSPSEGSQKSLLIRPFVALVEIASAPNVEDRANTVNVWCTPRVSARAGRRAHARDRQRLLDDQRLPVPKHGTPPGRAMTLTPACRPAVQR
jgi:hypothetical protein